MPKTQLFTIGLQDFNQIEAGNKSYITERMKTPLVAGQKVIIQAMGTDAEIETVLTDVHRSQL